MNTKKNNFEYLEFELDSYMQIRINAEDERQIEEIDHEIWEKYGGDWAILFTDLSGFSRNVYDMGILYTMEVIYMFKNLAIPIIEAHNGTIIKIEGDSFIVLFQKIEEAYRVATDINHQLNVYNERQVDRKIYNASGIGYGKILKISNQDLYGLEVNLASKLGEDVAKGGEILLTEAAKNELDQKIPLAYEKFTMNQGIQTEAYRLIDHKTEQPFEADMTCEILKLGDERLYEMSLPVGSEEFGDLILIKKKLHDTLMTFRKDHGVGRGIAAPQIGIFKRVIYTRIDDESTLYVNPKLSWLDEEWMDVWDDCMCFPNLLVNVKRHLQCRIDYQNEAGEWCYKQFEGDLSELIQHEYDHLDGILATDRMQIKRGMKYR